MRKIIFVSILLFLFSCIKPKPEGLILKIRYQPERTYQITAIRRTETVITYSGQEMAMRKLKSMRIKNPTISKVKTKTETELVTGKSSENVIFPITLTYLKTRSLDGKNEIPEGTVIQGEITGESKPTFNKVVSGILDFDQKSQLLKMVNSTFDQFNFPEKQLKIGDQFSADRPASIPMEGSVIQTVVTTTCKLIQIKNNIAEFELNQSYLMNPKIMDNSFKGSGTGKGRFTYDIKNSLITDYAIKTELIMNKKLDYFEFDLKTVNEFSQQTTLVVK